MPRLIDADKLISKFCHHCTEFLQGHIEQIEDCKVKCVDKRIMENMPTIEAIPIDYLLARVEAQEKIGRSGATTFLRRVIKEWREE